TRSSSSHADSATRTGVTRTCWTALVALYAEDTPEPYAYVQVGILLSTGEVDGAWAAAHEFRCSAGLLFAVAEQRAATHPADAIPIYARAVEIAIDRKNQSGHTEAARLLGVLKELHQRASGDFPGYLATVKETHRRKSTLLAELARARL